MQHWASRRVGLMGAVMAGALLAGCAGGGGNGPSAASLPAGETCGSIKAKLNNLYGKGVASSIEAQNRGQKISPAAKADADAYNKLLNDYLGAKCHV